MTLLTSKLLSRTLLRGQVSSFSLELPPYRLPQIGKVLVRSLLDRTLFVLGRAVTVAMPAGAVLWLLSNLAVSGRPLLAVLAGFLQPLGDLMGLDGMVLLAFFLAFPANEIMLPVLAMGYLSTSVMADIGTARLGQVLALHGWSWQTAVCAAVLCLTAAFTAMLCDHLVAWLRHRPCDKTENSSIPSALVLVLLLPACGKPNAGSSGSGSMSGSGAASQTTAAWKTGLGVVVETEDEDRTGSIRLHHMGRGGVDDGAFLPQEHHPVQTVGVAGAVDALDRFALILCGARQTLHQSRLAAARPAFEQHQLHSGLPAQRRKVALEPGGRCSAQKEIHRRMHGTFHTKTPHFCFTVCKSGAVGSCPYL